MKKYMLKSEIKNDRYIFFNDRIEITLTKRNFKHNLTFFSLDQIHSDKFYFIKDFPKLTLQGDGIITDKKNFPICIKTADCLTIFVYSSEIISAIHCGWRSSSKRILQKVIDFLINEIKINLNEFFFFFSHCICEKCYVVKEDMKKEFLNNYGQEGELFFKKINNYEYLFSLKDANLKILKDYKIAKDKIFFLNKCTICDNNEFYSYRKEKTTKRNFNIITLKEENRCL